LDAALLRAGIGESCNSSASRNSEEGFAHLSISKAAIIKFASFTFVVGFALTLASDGISFAMAPNPGAGTACQRLLHLAIPNVAISSAVAVSAGPFNIPDSQQTAPVPAFCRVAGVAHPTSDSDISFEIWIPDGNSWNGKFHAVGGYGRLPYGDMLFALQRGYAVESNDMGHHGDETRQQGDDLIYGMGHPEKVIDWAYRAAHVSAEIGKLIVRDRTGRWPDHSYFVGCSVQGQEALSEAQRFPDDFDGIIAGDPAADRLHQLAGFIYSWNVTHDANGVSLVPMPKLAILTHAIVQSCGDKDGIIEDARSCQFDPASLKCLKAENDQCLTVAQIDAIKKVYAGTYNPRTGRQIYPGWPRGSENFGQSAAEGWAGFIIQPKRPIRSESYSYWLFDDPNWNFRTFDFDRDVAFGEAKLAYISAIDPDLSRFSAHGGKLLMYTGSIDPVVPPDQVTNYYDSVVKKMGGSDNVQAFFRFFMVPGMGHCRGGPGATDFDMLTVLERWVEHGIAPETVVAAHKVNNVPTLTRPLCLYPQVAKWTGHGSEEDAADFVCKAPGKPVN
jgi:feruloyl esterase